MTNLPPQYPAVPDPETELDLKALRVALVGRIQKCDETERLLRLTCAKIVDGLTRNPTLEEMRGKQSAELADISLAIETAYLSMRSNRDTKESKAKQNRQRAEKAEAETQRLGKLLAELSGFLTSKEVFERFGGPLPDESPTSMAIRLLTVAGLS